MQIILKHIVRNIQANKIRSFLIILTLSMTAFVFYLDISVSNSIAVNLEKSMRNTYKNLDIKVSVKEEEFQKTFAPSDVRVNTAAPAEIVMTRVTPGWYPHTVREGVQTKVDFIQAEREVLLRSGALAIREYWGGWDPAVRDQIIISERAAADYGLVPGARMNIIFGDEISTFTVGAIAANTNFMMTEPTSMMFVFAQTGTLETVAAGTKDIMYLDIEETDIQRLIAELEQENTAFDVHALYDYEGLKATIANTQNILLFILLVMIAINFFIIRSVMKLILVARTPVMGTFRSCGAANSMVSRILILENAVYGGLAGLLGIALGILLNREVIRIFTGYRDVTAEIWLPNILFTILFSIGIQLAIVGVSLIRFSKKPVMETIFTTGDTPAAVKRGSVIWGLGFLGISVGLFFLNTRYRLDLAVLTMFFAILGGFLCIGVFSKFVVRLCERFMPEGPVKMGFKNLAASQATLSNIVLVTVVLSVILMIYLLALSLTDFFERALSSTLQADYVVTNLEKEPESYIFFYQRAIEQAKYSYNEFGNTVINDTDFSLLQIVGMDEAAFGVQDPENILPDLQDREMVMDRIFAAKSGFQIGDQLEIASEFFGDGTMVFTLKGFADVGDFNLNRRVLLINMNAYRENVAEIPDMALINTADTSEETFFNLNQQALSEDLVLNDTDTYVGSQQDQVTQIFSMVYLMLGLSMILALVGITNNQMIGFMKKQKEYSILLSVAMTKKQIKKMIFSEVIGSFVLSCLFGSGFGLLFFELMRPLLIAVNLGVVSAISITSLLLFVMIVFAVLAVTVLVPVSKLDKLDIVEQIKYEG